MIVYAQITIVRQSYAFPFYNKNILSKYIYIICAK